MATCYPVFLNISGRKCVVIGGGSVALRTAYQESVALEAQDLLRELGEGVPGADGLRYRTVRRDGQARVELVEQVLDHGEPRWVVRSRTALDVPSGPGSLVFVGATESSELVLDVQDVVAGSPLVVERAVRRYGPDGALRGEAAVPRGTYAPAHALALAADGTVLALRPTGAGVEVWVWDGGTP